MKFDRFMIAPLDKGQTSNVRPWLIPDNAFEELRNCYCFRSRIRKRFGSRLMNQAVPTAQQPLYSRFRMQIGTTDINGDMALTVIPGVYPSFPGQWFAVIDLAAPTTNLEVFTVTDLAGPTVITTGTGSITLNTGVPNISITGSIPSAQVWYYPGLPVMGLPNYETGFINDYPLLGFDTQFSYIFNTGTFSWQRAGTQVWSGTDADFFWDTTYIGAAAALTNNVMYASNNVDPIRYWDGTDFFDLTPVQINAAGDQMTNALIVLPFKDRLVALNTTETAGQFIGRARYSQNGTPLTTVDANAWRQDIAGKGGFVDAPTSDRIVSAEFLRDRLIVYFSGSTWQLVYTRNEIVPFVWQQINTELGATSTYSIVPFDAVALGVSNYGIHQCTGASVQRIDQLIPDAAFGLEVSNQQINRIHGIRDYFTEMVYWTWVDNEVTVGVNDKYPQQIVAYNYKNGSWGDFDDSITCWGYFLETRDLTWETFTKTWGDEKTPWGGGTTVAQLRTIVAGNQTGFTFIIDSELTRNAAALAITDIQPGAQSNLMDLTIVQHNLQIDDYIAIEDVQGTATLPNLNNKVFPVVATASDNVVTIDVNGLVANNTVAGTYQGFGTAARVSRIGLLTKQYNFYAKDGRNSFISKVDFLVDRSEGGKISFDYLTSTSDTLRTSGALTGTGAIMGTNVITLDAYDDYPYEQNAVRLWRPIYLQAEGEVIQLLLIMNDAQMTAYDTDPDTGETAITTPFQGFTLHAFTLYATPSSRLQ